MADAVTRIVTVDEEEANRMDIAWSPGMIIEVLKTIDPDDLDDVQQGLYEFLWGPGGHFAEEGRTEAPSSEGGE